MSEKAFWFGSAPDATVESFEASSIDMSPQPESEARGSVTMPFSGVRTSPPVDARAICFTTDESVAASTLNLYVCVPLVPTSMTAMSVPARYGTPEPSTKFVSVVPLADML